MTEARRHMVALQVVEGVAHPLSIRSISGTHPTYDLAACGFSGGEYVVVIEARSLEEANELIDKAYETDTMTGKPV